MKRLLFAVSMSLPVLLTALPALADDWAGQAATAAQGVVTNEFRKNLDKMPDWMKRTDLDVDISELSKPTWSIETVQPLYQTPDSLSHTIFTQGRYGHRDSNGTINLGLGYRYLLDNKDWMLGANLFYDVTTRRAHQRVGVGAEAIGRYAKARANYYNGITQEKTVSDTGNNRVTEKALNGWDAEIEAPIPFLPWLHVAGSTYHWDSEASPDIHGETVRLRMNIYNNLYMELGRSDDNTTRAFHFIKLEMSLGSRPGQTATLFGKPVSSEILEGLDLSKHTLDKVRRNNDIVVERKRNGSGIPIGRRN